MDDQYTAPLLQQGDQQLAPLFGKLRLFVDPLHVFFRMKQQRHRFIQGSQAREKTDHALALALVAQIELGGVTGSGRRSLCRGWSSFVFCEVTVQGFVIQFLHVFAEPLGNQQRSFFQGLRPFAVRTDTPCQSVALGGRLHRPGKVTGGRDDEFPAAGQTPVAGADAADMGRIKRKGPAQHIVFGSRHLHEEIQLIGNNVFHRLYPFADAQRGRLRCREIKVISTQ